MRMIMNRRKLFGLKINFWRALCEFVEPLSHQNDELLPFAKSVNSNPLLQVGKKNEWDGGRATWASIVREERKWLMYYTGRDLARVPKKTKEISCIFQQILKILPLGNVFNAEDLESRNFMF